MVEFLTCFKCWGGKAVLTYEENRIYKVSCECGCEYTFEHCSMKAAQEYHNKMLELHDEIDRNVKFKADIRFKDEQISALKTSNDGLCYSHDSLGAQITALKADNERLRAERDAAIKDLNLSQDCKTCGNKTTWCDSNPDKCKGWQWRGIEGTP